MAEFELAAPIGRHGLGTLIRLITELGREVFERAVSILDALEDTGRLAESAKGEPQGVLRLTCGEEFGLCVVTRWIAGYLIDYPKMRVEADYTNRIVDIVKEGYDLAIRVGALGDGDLTARKLGQAEYGLFASPGYPTPKVRAFIDHAKKTFSAALGGV